MSVPTATSACNRFGLGARPGELARIDDPRAWLLAQLRKPPTSDAFADLPSSLAYLQRENDYLRERRQRRRAGAQSGDAPATQAQDTDMPASKPRARNDDAQAMARQLYRQSNTRELAARYRHSVEAADGFAERLVRFWSNHFAISVDKRQASLYAAPMEREAIRPHVMGEFATLLAAVETHPGMLRYLDNVRSVGADSTVAERARRRAARNGGGAPKRTPGLNENLAREILELHTLGVDGGYGQGDVTELARAITGWGVPGPQDFARGAPKTSFVFRAAAHEDGARTVLGRRYGAEGQRQGLAILADLAVHPSTARHLCGKLARHFVGDAPPQALVERMAAEWTRSNGELPAVYRVLVESDEAWSPQARKFKTPDDFVVSAMRAVGEAPRGNARLAVGLLARMGQPPFTPRSPAGFADDQAQWSGPDALWKRVQAAASLADAAPQARVDPLRTAQDVFAGTLDADTLTALRRAESPRDGLALLIASPAFQWRT